MRVFQCSFTLLLIDSILTVFLVHIFFKGHPGNSVPWNSSCFLEGINFVMEFFNYLQLCLYNVFKFKISFFDLQSAPACDSMSLNISKWFALPSAPYCVSFLLMIIRKDSKVVFEVFSLICNYIWAISFDIAVNMICAFTEINWMSNWIIWFINNANRSLWRVSKADLWNVSPSSERLVIDRLIDWNNSYSTEDWNLFVFPNTGAKNFSYCGKKL